MDKRSTFLSPNHLFEGRRLILASQSPRRRQLLEWAELQFEVIISPTDESYPPGLDTADIPVHIARQKAEAVLSKPGHQDAILIAADTVVVADGQIIGKPSSPEEAFDILSKLSGRTHHVITG